MTDKEQELLKRLLRTFRTEAEDHLKNLTTKLLELEKTKEPELQQDLIEIIFRETHSLKGAARTVNLSAIESVCQRLESVFANIKKSEQAIESLDFDTLHKVVDRINQLVLPKSDNESEERKIVLNAIQLLEQISSGDSQKTQPAAESPRENVEEAPQNIFPKKKEPSDSGTEMIRMSVKKLSDLMSKIENLLTIKLAIHQWEKDSHYTFNKLNIWNTEFLQLAPALRNLPKYIKKPDKIGSMTEYKSDLTKLIRFYEWSESYMKDYRKEWMELLKKIKQDTYQTDALINSLLDDIKSTLAVPFSTLLEVFPKTVRDISSEQGKKIDLVLQGEEIEIDRRILEEIKAPMIHLIRNCIDHGIEKPSVRLEHHKPERGTISITIEHIENNKVGITITDDGMGIQLDLLRKHYIEKVKPDKKNLSKLTDAILLEYMFLSGVSTNRIITDISGRGLGLPIVREKIEHLGGTIDVTTESGSGTTFYITLPLTLVSFRGVLIKVSDRNYILPSVKVNQILRVQADQVKTAENNEIIKIDDKIIPVVHLNEIFDLPPIETKNNYLNIIILGTENNQLGFLVDEVLGEQEVLIKKYGKQLTRARYFSGATILGSGELVPLLNVSDLIIAGTKEAIIGIKAKTPEAEIHDKHKTALVVEDSITSRMLLKNILETAGYSVQTAVDGMEGYTILKGSEFDVLVSDIDMPRMNGFELAEKIRADKKLENLPIVLVTSLQSQEDRERGLEAGADAYIVKSSFDQSNLLEVIEKLV